MLEISSQNIKIYENKLKSLRERSLPFATREAINNTAFRAQKLSKQRVEDEMVLKNRWTLQSIRVVPERRSLIIRQQQAVVGSTVDYMETQEFGGTKTAKGKHGAPIPTTVASGEGRGTQPRKKVTRRASRLGNLVLPAKAVKSKSRRQRNAIAVATAAKTKKKYVFLDLGKRKGIFKISGGKRRTKVDMLYDLSSKVLQIEKKPWLRPSSLEAKGATGGFYIRALRKQITRLTNR